MKQKRKVKSLISSNDRSNVGLTALLCLLGGILVFGAVALFTSSVGVEAANNEEQFEGIDDKHEVLLDLGFIPYGENTPVNEMFLKGKTFFLSGNVGVSVNISNSNNPSKYINHLGGEGMSIDSENVTIIGGKANKLGIKNDNATILGGVPVGSNGNGIDDGNNNVAPVMLGGQGNKIGKYQEGSAIVGGKSNTIGDNVSYGFIIGGGNNSIGNGGTNVIVGGARVTVNGKSNLFAFSDDRTLEPTLGNAFYVNVTHGLGLNMASRNEGVDSNGAVSFGPIYIDSQNCTSTDVGVQGTWNGCLVGCTLAGVNSGNRWEMIDHGDTCESECDRSDRCMVSPIKPEEPTPYTGYCTTDGVNTGHSHHCGGENAILPNYQNIVFETKLIDSDDKCPSTANGNWTENRCVFKCDGGYHLTGGADGRAICYKDCELVWDHSTIKHNETVTAYKRTDVNCSYNSDSQMGPYTCKNYKATLVCDNGTLKVKQSFASSSENGKDAYDLGYQYNECMLHQYRCPATYNYNKSQISSVFNDAPTNGSWNIQNRQKIVGTRGQYKLCVDYDAVTRNTVQYLDGESCFERDKNADNSYNLHYQWLGCNDHYHTGSRSNYVCMKDCTLKNPNGTTKYYLHETRITGYKNGSVDCGSAGNGKCESETLICNDGNWTKLNGAITDVYKYNDCSLNDFNCVLTEYNVDESTKTAHQGESVYASSCISYDGQDDKVTCSKRRTDYKLTNCVGGHSTYHTDVEDEGRNKWCISNDGERQCTHAGATVSHHFHYINALVPVRWSGTAYNNGSWSTPANCGWECDTNYHEEYGDCTSNSRNVNCSDYYTLPANASWKRQGYQLWNISQGKWNSPLYCSWDCNSGWHENAAGTACEKDCTVVSCSAYTLDSCPDHGHCSECTKVDASCNDGETKLKLDYCDTDYEVSSDGTSCEYNPSCTANYCSAYGLDECPEGGICSWCTIKYTDCTNGDQKARLDSCEDGYNKVGDTCVPDDGDDGGDDGDYGGKERPGGGEDCSSTPHTYGSCSFSIPALSNGASTTETYSDSTYYGSTTAKCTNGTLSYSSESCITVCSSSGNPAGCNGSFSATYPSTATWGSSYSYTCKYGTLSYSCSANCPSGTYWMGNDVYCATAQTICGSTHNNCTNGGSYVSNSAGSTSTTYTWKCKRADYTEPCTEAKQECSNILEKQNCEVGHGGSAQGTWNDSTCSCDCPAGTIVTDDNHCAQEGGSSGGGTCDTYREFNPPWALYCPAPSGNYDSQCNSEAGAGWSCSFNDSCPGRVAMCECTRTAQCQSCTGCPSGTVAHGGKCTSYSSSSACTCPTARTSTCNNGSWDVTPYSYGSCTSGVGCGGGGGGCFLAGTPVITSEGPKNIEDIEVGDMVLSYNTLTLKNEYNKVTKLMIHENNNDDIYELIINGKLLEVTSVHPFFVVNDNQKDNQCNMQFKIRRAQSLKVGDKLMMSDGRYVTIESITHRHNYGTVYNFEVENVHNYFVGEGYLVHNLQQKQMVVNDDAIGDGYGGGCGVTVNAFRNEVGVLCGRYDSCNGNFSTAGC